jgi:polysaccharide export outer membrane protein
MMKRVRLVMPALALLVSLTGVACAQTSPAGPAPAAGAAAAPPAAQNGVAADYRIGPEDVLDIAVWNNPGISRTAPVRPDGKISLPLLNDLQAAGLTPMELRGVIAEKLQEYMANPEVSVIVREVRRAVSVLGEVKRPGRYEFKSHATVLDAIALAGGLSDFAARTRILILRNEGNGTKRIRVNYNKIVSADGEVEDISLRPGDTVVVP